MDKRKWKWLTGTAALIIMLSFALSAGLAQEQEEEKAAKKSFKNIFKRKAKTEEVVEAEEAAEAALEGETTEESSDLAPTPMEPGDDWLWEDTPVEMGPGSGAPVAAPPPGQKIIRLHQVSEGENLHMLAAYYYGDARAWPRIYNLNKKKIRNPNIIRVGVILNIEVEPGWKPRFDLAEFKLKEKKRQAAIEQAKMEKPTIIRETQTIIPTITPLTELEEEEEEERPGVPVPGLIPIEETE